VTWDTESHERQGEPQGEPGRQADPLLTSAGVSGSDLEALLALISGTDITELHVTISGAHLSVKRPPSAAVATIAGVTPQTEPLALAIASPLVGIFRPSVTTGEHVQQGQSIGAIEALGMPTSVDVTQSGTVEDLLVPDGTPVEYGQPLLILRRMSHDL
jgi:acetyl-CoA carboxylase biotin carboxyl carrier protein